MTEATPVEGTSSVSRFADDPHGGGVGLFGTFSGFVAGMVFGPRTG